MKVGGDFLMIQFLAFSVLFSIDCANIWGSMSNNRNANEATNSRIAHAATLQFTESQYQSSTPSNLLTSSGASQSGPGSYKISGTTNRRTPAYTVATLITATTIPLNNEIIHPDINSTDEHIPIIFLKNDDLILDSLDQLVGSQKK